MLAVIYILLFVLQVFLLIRCFRSRSGWGKLLILNFAASALACGMAWYYDSLTGTVALAGWAYFREVFYSLCAALVYGLQILIAFLGMMLRKKK